VQSARTVIERGDCVFLVQRPENAPKMAGMWELPECALASASANPDPMCASVGSQQLCVVRHSITDTDYEVRVLRGSVRTLSEEQKRTGRWVQREEFGELPLTGLTRKILRKLAAFSDCL
jgi:A/G-specific adenine glycosylase